MGTQIVHARVIIPDTTTLEDATSNSFTFAATGSDANLTLSEVKTAITNFYNTTATGQTNALAKYMSSALSRVTNACQILYYDITTTLNGANIGSPIQVDTWTLGAANTPNVPLPAGLAACIGFRGAYGSGDFEHGPTAAEPSSDEAIDEGAPATHTAKTRPRARERGRVYLGPLELLTMKTSTVPGIANASYLDDTFRTDCGKAIDKLYTQHNPGAHDQFDVVVWSRRDPGISFVGFYFVDEGFAYQRRREDDTINRVHLWNAL